MIWKIKFNCNEKLPETYFCFGTDKNGNFRGEIY